MTIWPLVFVRRKRKDAYTPRVNNHERIHGEQQKEMLWIFFFLWYGAEYLIRLVATRNHKKAYKGILLEREAFENMDDLDYLHRRKMFAWIINNNKKN